MSKATQLDAYVRMIEDLLAQRLTAGAFSGRFFRTFQDDPTHWGGRLYEALNSVALMAEGYEPGPKTDEFDVTETELRAECRRRLSELRDLQRDLQG